MQERYVGSALVLEGEQLRGILTERDLLRAVASGRIEGETVEDWMTGDPETIEPSDETGTPAPKPPRILLASTS